MSTRLSALGLLMVGAVLACGDAPSFTIGSIEFAGPAGSGEPSLYATSDGRAILTWHEPEGEGYALRVAERRAGEWSEPKTVATGLEFFVNWADFPSLIERGDGAWVVHWLERTTPKPYAYHVKLAVSTNRGDTWSEPVVPHGDRSPTEHGFVSMVPWNDGGVAIIWLDGRQMVTGRRERGNGNDRAGSERGAMSLRFTIVSSDGTPGEDVLLDDRTCECCQTALVRTAGGLVAAYRDRAEDELRNIAVVGMRDGVWSQPMPVNDDGWRIRGCPVNGPQLSARGDNVVIAWFTAPEHRPRVNVAFSGDGGATFGPPSPVDDGNPAGRVDVEMLEDGSAVVVWLERKAGDAEIRARVVHPDGGRRPSWRVTATGAGRAAGFPRMARAGNELLFAWTDPSAKGGVRVVAARGP